LARNNNISATFSQDAGDGASGFSESSGTKSFTSGDAIKIEGSIDTSAVQYATANFGFAQADGIYFENRDSTNFVTVTLQEAASGSDLCALKIAPNSVFMIRFDASQTEITHVTLQADTAACDFVLCLAE
jgi:hypothetical protein